MTQTPACYQDVDDVLDLSYVPNTSEDIDVDDILDLSYVPNTAEAIVLTQAPAPMTVTPGSYTRGNTPFPPQGTRSCSQIQEGDQTWLVIFCCIERQQAMGLCSPDIEGPGSMLTRC
jgi:hypothetical protein